MMYEFQCSVIFVAPAVMQNNMEPMQVQQMEANLTKLIKEVIGQLGSVEAKLNHFKCHSEEGQHADREAELSPGHVKCHSKEGQHADREALQACLGSMRRMVYK